jgi:hypothetical protein
LLYLHYHLWDHHCHIPSLIYWPSVQLTRLYQLMEDQLQQQQHVDKGMSQSTSRRIQRRKPLSRQRP